MNKVITPGTPLRDICKGFRMVYEPVGIMTNMPLYRWTQVSNDVADLAEKIRRPHMEDPALQRLAKILARILEFVGRYTEGQYPRISLDDKIDFNSLIHASLRYQSISGSSTPADEYLSKWIRLKFPGGCSKCGKPKCECVLDPQIFEERHEKPDGYIKTYADKVETQRVRLSSWEDFTIEDLFKNFATIYGHSLYHQDPWKVVAHLSEEIGEVSTELTRLELLSELPRGRMESEVDTPDGRKSVWESIVGKVEQRIRRRLDDFEKHGQNMASQKLSGNLASFREKVTSVTQQPGSYIGQWAPMLQDYQGADELDLARRLFLAEVISYHIKEELADVTSWVCAAATVIKPRQDSKAQSKMVSFSVELPAGSRAVMANLIELYSFVLEGQEFMSCAHCNKGCCDDGCLLRNVFADELAHQIERL